MTPEELALMEAGALPESTEPELTELVEEELDDLGIIGEEIAVLAIENEERHEEILECLNRLENSSETENPSSQAMLTEQSMLKAEIAELKGLLSGLSMAMSHSHQEVPPRSESSTEETPVENPSEQSRESSTEEPRPEDRRPKRRIL